VPGWVAIFGRVNHLGTEPGTQAYSARARPLWQAEMSTRQKLGINRHVAWYISPYPWSRSVVLVPGWIGWLAEISGDIREAACSRRCAIQIDHHFTSLLVLKISHTTYSHTKVKYYILAATVSEWVSELWTYQLRARHRGRPMRTWNHIAEVCTKSLMINPTNQGNEGR